MSMSGPYAGEILHNTAIGLRLPRNYQAILSSRFALVWVCRLEVELLQVSNGLKSKAGEEAGCS